MSSRNDLAHRGGEKVAGNILSLASGELLSRAIAFFVTAYLSRKLDPAGFGVIGFAAALLSYFYFAGAIRPSAIWADWLSAGVCPTKRFNI